ncbi:MAG: hypothetical protein LBP82_04195, partial [Candidatus Methanoplasma sp.]|nr:hypothetical protein [Candidatus Methanoplasma sp.]
MMKDRKKNKMVLALIVVAAFAAVSFAGAVSISSMGAAAQHEMGLGLQTVISGDVTADQYFFIDEEKEFGSANFVVPADSTY